MNYKVSSKCGTYETEYPADTIIWMSRFGAKKITIEVLE